MIFETFTINFYIKRLSIILFASIFSLCLLSDDYSHIKWKEWGKIRSDCGNITFSVPWSPDRGIVCAVEGKDKTNRVYITLRSDFAKIDTTHISVPVPLKNRTVSHPDSLPKRSQKKIHILLKLRKTFWAVYCNNKPILRFPVPFRDPNILFIAESMIPAGTKPDTRFQKTIPFYFQDDFLVEESAQNQLASWDILMGTWDIHTALEDAIEQKSSTRLQKRPLEAQRSANFYSLRGTGEPALITGGYSFYDHYTLQAGVQLKPGTAGLAFYILNEKQFYTFTLTLAKEDMFKDAIGRLQYHNGKNPPEILEAIALKNILPGQWFLLKTVITDNRIQAYIDGCKVMEADTILPAGGQFGLYVNSKEKIRFDDVHASTYRDLELNDIASCKFHAIAIEGDVFYAPSFLSRISGYNWLTGRYKNKNRLFSSESGQDRWIIFGSPSDKGQIISADFYPEKESFKVGLIVGFKGRKDKCYRIVCQQKDSKRDFHLESLKLDGDTAKVKRLCSSSTSLTNSQVEPTKFNLKINCRKRREWRVYFNDKLVLIYQPESTVYGGGGIWVGKDSDVVVNHPGYTFSPEDLYFDQQEKNELFAKDPYMRHWSSPEGQWLKDKEGYYWFKGDIFGPFSITLPSVVDSKLQFGIEESSKKNVNKSGIIIEIRGNKLLILDAANNKTLLEKSVKDIFKDYSPLYKVMYENGWLWGSFRGNIFFKLKLNKPLTGTRMRCKGFLIEHLSRTRVTRKNVKDFLFTKAPFEWTVNGGRWQIINRFQCDPRWSHVNGESKDEVAGIWSKYRFHGDFCLEMYAGIRHGWYNRVGDLNITVMNQQGCPSQGYTFICTGWDPDHSQKFTRFFRNGKLLDSSDKYLAPRYRDGNIRKYINPLLKAGRPVHGAWYYMKIRRINDLVEYYFDNTKIFSYRDKHPIEAGSLGLWTFMNSMVIARLKMAAEKISRAPVNYRKIHSVNTAESCSQKTPENQKVTPSITVNGESIQTISPRKWTPEKGAGYPKIRFRTDIDDEQYFVTTDILGSGKFYIAGNFQKYPVNKLLGWSFLIKRTPNAQFNFHYELGYLNSDGHYKCLKKFFHRLSGSDYCKAEFKPTGETKIPPNKNPVQTWNKSTNWTAVNVWTPNINFSTYSYHGKLVWLVKGFGNLQPSDISQGLTGNNPGSAYAVKGFAPIMTELPALKLDEVSSNTISFALKTDRETIRTDSINEVNQGIEQASRPGINHLNIAVKENNSRQNFPIKWIQLPKALSLSCKWATDRDNTVIVSNKAPYSDPRLTSRHITVNGIHVKAETSKPNQFSILLPYKKEMIPSPKNKESLAITLTDANKKIYKLKLGWKRNPRRTPPVLVKLDGITQIFENFEHNATGGKINVDPNRMKILDSDPTQGTCLRVQNNLYNQRLNVQLAVGQSIANYPILQFRYLADYMGYVSLRLNNRTYVKINEPHHPANAVRWANEFKRDEKWHTWSGKISDAFRSAPLHSKVFTPWTMVLGSAYSKDQTGKNSVLMLDDLVLGPAISKAEQLAFTPHYFSFYGPVTVYYAINAGIDSYPDLSTKQKKKIVWTQIKNDTRTVPLLKNLKEGASQLFLKAKDSKGKESKVTSIPFLYDKSGFKSSLAMEKTTHHAGNLSQLRFNANVGDGVPLDVEKLKLFFGDKAIPFYRYLSTVNHTPSRDSITLNWPYLLHREILKMKNGEKRVFKISSIYDGAGNKSPDVTLPISVNYAKDKTPPSFMPFKTPDSIGYFTNWTGRETPVNPFRIHHRIRAKMITGFNKAPYLELLDRKKKGYANLTLKIAHKKLVLKDFPFLGIRLRWSNKEKSKYRIRPRIILTLVLSDNKRYHVSLTYRRRGRKYLNLRNRIDLKANEWQSIILNLQHLVEKKIKGSLKTENMNDIRINEIILVMKGGGADSTLDLSNLAIFGKSSPNDKISIRGYDQSGTDKFKWEFFDSTNSKLLAKGVMNGNKFPLSKLPASTQKPGWLNVNLIDRPGNISRPAVVPICLEKPGKK